MTDTQSADPVLLDKDWDGLQELMARADGMPPTLRPTVGPTMDHQFAAQSYIEEMEAAKFPQLLPFEELQLESLLEVAEGILANEEGPGPFEVWSIPGADPKPRDKIILYGWLALINRRHIAYLQDQKLGDNAFIARLVIFRH